MILVTGGTGLLGSHLLFDLVNSGNKVRAIKRKNSNVNHVLKVFKYYSKNADELFSEIEWADADILDFVSVLNVMQGIDKVYHCAAIISYLPGDKYKMFENNVTGTENIVNASLQLNIKKLCYVSSIAALGNSVNGDFIDEDTPWNFSSNKSGYSVSKYFAEQEVWRGIAEGLNAVMVNPSIILGPGNWNSGSSVFFKKIWNNFNFYTSGINGFVYVKDVSKIMINLMEKDISNERFVISYENISYKTLFDLIAKSLGKKSPKYEATRFVSLLIVKLGAFAGIFGLKPFITKETFLTSQKKLFFSNKKVTDKTGIIFTPMEETINEIGKIFLSEHKK